MNLTDYLNQKEPKRGNKVILNALEFTKGATVKAVGSASLTQIFIHEYPLYNYVLKGQNGYIHTADEHGNANKLSCFYIEDINAVGLKHDGSNYDEFINSMSKEVGQLFEQIENQSLNGFDYKQLASYLNSFNLLGWTFEYYLDAEPYDFRPMTSQEKKDFETSTLFI